MGEAAHARHELLSDPDVWDRALVEAGLSASDREMAIADHSLWHAALEEHRQAVQRCQAFGVPTVALEDGHGP